MRIFMTGATGVVGRRAVPLLISAGHAVTAVGRTEQSRAALERAGAVPMEVNLFDPRAVSRAITGHDAVVNLATHIPHSTLEMFLPGAWRENDRIRREASRVLAEATVAAGVPRFIQESFAPMYADAGEMWIDERGRIEPARYNLSTVDAEHSAESVTRRGGTGVILRFAAFYGPDAFHVRELMEHVRKGRAPLPGSPAGFLSSVSHDDAASAVLAALRLRAGVYNVADDEPQRRRDFVDALAEALGVGSPKFPPAWVFVIGGSLTKLMSRSLRISNRKLREESGWRPRFPSVRQGWKATVEAISGRVSAEPVVPLRAVRR